MINILAPSHITHKLWNSSYESIISIPWIISKNELKEDVLKECFVSNHFNKIAHFYCDFEGYPFKPVDIKVVEKNNIEIQQLHNLINSDSKTTSNSFFRFCYYIFNYNQNILNTGIKYCDIIHNASESKHNIDCGFYVRLPIVWYKQFVTEIYIAVPDDVDLLRQLLSHHDPIYNTFLALVSLVNSKVAFIMGEIVGRNAILESAFRNFGHTLKNRSEAITNYFSIVEKKWHNNYQSQINSDTIPERYLDKEEREYHKSWLSSKTFPKLASVLQLWGFHDINHFWNFWGDNLDKKKRFFDYDKNINVKRLLNRIQQLAYINKILEIDENSYQTDIYLKIVYQKNFEIYLNPEIIDPFENRKCVLKEDIVDLIFFEIFRNATEYGIAKKINAKDINLISHVGIHINQLIEDNTKYLAFWNYCEVGSDFKSNKKLIPTVNDSGKGLGMISKVLTSLDLGNIKVKKYLDKNDRGIYLVAVDLKGLEINEA